MEWYYALNGQQHGPIDEAEFQRLISAGFIRPDTLVWRNGLAEWQPCANVRFAGTAAAPVAGGVVCAQCGGTFPPDQVMSFGAASVCATCKPVYVQRLREGAATYTIRTSRRTLPVDPDELFREIKTRDYTVDIGSCLSRSWGLLKSHLWLVVGTTFLVTLVMEAVGAIPFIGILIGLILNGPLIASLYAFYLKLVRGEPAGVGDGFSSFSKVFLQSMLGLVVMSLGIYVWFAPVATYAYLSGDLEAMRATFNTLVLTGRFDGHFPSAPTVLLFLAALVPVFYLSVAWTFSLLLIVDLEMNFWSAMQVSRRVVQMHWLSIFALMLASTFLSLLGCCAFCIGIFFTIPLLYCALTFCYEDIFGVKKP